MDRDGSPEKVLPQAADLWTSALLRLCEELESIGHLRYIGQAIAHALDDGPMNGLERHFAAQFEAPTHLDIEDHGLFEGGLSIDDMRRGVRRRVKLGEHLKAGSVPPIVRSLLYRLAMTRQPKQALEFGTCGGVSTAAIGMGMSALGSPGRFVTIEADESLHSLAVENLKHLGLRWIETRHGLFEDVLTDVLPEMEGIDFVFDDGQHTGADELLRFIRILPRCTPEALVVFDDIRHNAGMAVLWSTLREHPKVLATIDLERLGLCIVSPKSISGRPMTFRLAP
jgi:predicted O-methyltransferase YrrM